MSGAPDQFAQRLRSRQPMAGYWVVLDSPVSTERIARVGYDYVCFDAQHGLMGYDGLLKGMTAVDAGGVSAGMVRVGANDPYHIGRALDAGARGVIVPLVNTPEEAADAVRACRYPPRGVRSYGPMRSGLRVGPDPAAADDAVVCLAMIETAQGLANVEEICRVPGLDGVYVGPSDLTIGLGGVSSTDSGVAEEFHAALARVAAAAASADIAAGIHTPGGSVAAERLASGFTFTSIASDLTHLETAARQHLEQAISR